MGHAKYIYEKFGKYSVEGLKKRVIQDKWSLLLDIQVTFNFILPHGAMPSGVTCGDVIGKAKLPGK